MTMLYLSSFPEFQFLGSISVDKAEVILTIVMAGLVCIFLSLISRGVFRIVAYVFAGLGVFMSFVSAGKLN